MNLPNKITLVRILLIPLFAVLFLVQFPFHYLAACIVFIVASITDFIDGNIARRRNLVTNLGKFLDPFADKALVCTALVLITSFSNTFTFAIVIFTVIIIVRELMITAFRTVAATKKVILAAADTQVQQDSPLLPHHMISSTIWQEDWNFSLTVGAKRNDTWRTECI